MYAISELDVSKATDMVKTRILILSDTHSLSLAGSVPSQPVDFLIHCGDLTEESKLDEFCASIQLLQNINAPLKLVIAGNHDLTLDTPIFKKKIDEASPPLDPELVKKGYGDYGEARRLILDEQRRGIHFLNEGSHHFTLQNGAKLTVYASPYTPSLGDWGFQYHPDHGHVFDIEEGTSIVITHRPPKSVLDRPISGGRAGSADLFAALTRSKPLLHCFGHIHEGWGARLVTWREKLHENPSHLTDIDNERSRSIETLSTIRPGKFDDSQTAASKKERIQRYSKHKCCITNHCSGNTNLLERGKQTLFVNAAIQGDSEIPTHLPWVVESELPKSNAAASGHHLNSEDEIVGREKIKIDDDA